MYSYRCLHAFPGKEEDRDSNKWLREHIFFCASQKIQKITYLTTPDQKEMKFTNIHKQLKYVFVGYCDFESMAVTKNENATIKGSTGKVYPNSNQPWPTIDEVRNRSSDVSLTENWMKSIESGWVLTKFAVP